MSEHIRAICPRCDRSVGTFESRYNVHSLNTSENGNGRDRCPMSRLRIPASSLSDDDFEWRAKIVADLAAHMQDLDPAIVWEYLTALPALELQRMLIVALAAIPVDQTYSQMFGWVRELPAAATA